MYKSRRGITLIALVVTIIVLLLLAGIAISMLSGNNSILNKATEAKNKNSEGQIREEIALAWNAVQAKAIPEKWSLETKRSALQTELRNNGDDTATVTIDSENAKMLNIAYKGFEAEINTENDAINVTGGNGNSGNSGGNSGGGSGITASTPAEEVLTSGVYVTYKGQPYKVLYDANSTYGRIEIISVSPLTNVTLGDTDPAELANSQAGQAYVTANNITLIGNPGTSGTFDRAKWSYNNAIATLNYKAQAYLTNLADRARCVGTNPSNPNSPDNESNPSMYSNSQHAWLSTYNWNDEFKDWDTWEQYMTEMNQLIYINANNNTHNEWFGSRLVDWHLLGDNEECRFDVRTTDNGSFPLASVLENGTTRKWSPSYGLRPVIRLKSGVVVTGGQGTSGSPYTIALGTN